MKFSWIVCMMLLFAFTSPNVRAQTPKPLTELTPTASDYDFQATDQPFDLGGRVMHFGLEKNWVKDEAYSVYDLGGKYTRFETWVGAPEGYGSSVNGSYSIRLDGKKVVSNGDDPMKPNDPPKHIEVDVTGVQSLRLYGNYGIRYGEPILYRGTPASANIANLVAPQDRATESGSSINLLWEPTRQRRNKLWCRGRLH